MHKKIVEILHKCWFFTITYTIALPVYAIFCLLMGLARLKVTTIKETWEVIV